MPLHGAHQAQNAVVALVAVEAFLGAGTGERQLDPETVRDGFARSSLAGPAGAGPHARRRSCSTPPTTRTAWPPR